MKSKPKTKPIEDNDEDSRLIDKRELLFLIPMSFPSIWKMMLAGEFPRAVAIGSRSFWRAKEVKEWLTKRPIRKLKGDKVEA